MVHWREVIWSSSLVFLRSGRVAQAGLGDFLVFLEGAFQERHHLVELFEDGADLLHGFLGLRHDFGCFLHQGLGVGLVVALQSAAGLDQVDLGFLVLGRRQKGDGRIAAQKTLHDGGPVALAQVEARIELDGHLDVAGGVVQRKRTHLADAHAGAAHRRAGRDALGILEDDGIGVDVAEIIGKAAEQSDHHRQQDKRRQHEDAEAKADGLLVHGLLLCPPAAG